MKQQKQRVVAIDYFRGLCILAVLINHSFVFSTPFSYFTGAGRLWTSAAELFFIISGLTFGIVRADRLKTGLKSVVRRTWRRAAILYLVNVTCIFFLLGLAYFFAHSGVITSGLGQLPTTSPLRTIFNIFTMSYGIGYTTILMYYAIFLVVAPFALYCLYSRFWPVAVLASVGLFLYQSSDPTYGGLYYWLSIWQIYFVSGMVLARFRPRVLSAYFDLNLVLQQRVRRLVYITAGTVLSLSVLLEYNIYPTVDRLAANGWLPTKVQGAYARLMQHKPAFDFWLSENRTGAIRPLMALIILAALYLLYQQYKQNLLERSGRFVLAMGHNTLWIFVAQSFVIPILAALPVSRNIITNFSLTSILILSMLAIGKLDVIRSSISGYTAQLKLSYEEARYGYIGRYEDENGH